ncbi:MAG: guanine deaminase [Rhodothermales bacterium]|jgi:guanine deaminase
MPDLQKANLMRQAIELAHKNVASNLGGPFAALVTRGGEVIASGTNRVTSANDPTAHAEIVAIRNACAALDSFQLTGCDLYTTCEPCPMCLGAIYWARPDRVFYAAGRDDASQAGFDDGYIYREINRSPAERDIFMQQALRDEALSIFAAWQEKDDRREY